MCYKFQWKSIISKIVTLLVFLTSMESLTLQEQIFHNLDIQIGYIKFECSYTVSSFSIRIQSLSELSRLLKKRKIHCKPRDYRFLGNLNLLFINGCPVSKQIGHARVTFSLKIHERGTVVKIESPLRAMCYVFIITGFIGKQTQFHILL